MSSGRVPEGGFVPGGGVVSEFLAALGQRRTYSFTGNIYCLFGFLWGLPVPLVSVVVDVWASGRPFSPSLLWERPIHLLLLLVPLLLAVVFGAMGAVRYRKERQIAELLGTLEDRARDLAEVNEKLKESDRLKAQFMSNVVHEFKTPLLAVRGFGETVLEGRHGPVTEPQREALAAAMRNVEKLQHMAEEIMEYGRIESGGYKPDLSAFDLVTVVREALEGFGPQVERRGLSIQLQLPKKLEIHADREMIRRVLLNLFSNAIKFSPDGSPLGMGARVGEEDGHVLLTVWDRGPGIPTAAQKYLFTRFWQGDGSSRRKQGGTGLGLAIVKGILDAHGSTIRIVSGEGQGTSVHFTLPLAESGPG